MAQKVSDVIKYTFFFETSLYLRMFNYDQVAAVCLYL